jgi:small basic protein
MVEKPLARLGLTAMAVLAAAVTLSSLRYYGVLDGAWLGIDPQIRAVITEVPAAALTHMLIAPVALLLGPFQFLPGLRARRPQVHRWSGRAYVAACVVGGAGALATAFHASGGWVAGLGFAVLAVLWVGATLGAWRAAVQRQFERHRLLMRFSYAMTFAAVTLRLQIPLGFALGYPSYSAMSVWLAYTSWIPNVIIVALYSLASASRRPASAAA